MKEPRPYQRTAIERATRANQLIGDDKGLGKTLEAIEAAKLIYAQFAAPILIVAPKRTILQWVDAIAEQDPGATVVVIDVKTQLPAKPFVRRKVWVLTHYEAMLRHAKKLALTFWSTIVADEAHRIKNRTAQRSAALKLIQAYRKIALTGTPFDKDPSDIWSILNWLDPERYAERNRRARGYWQFREDHAIQEPIYKAGVRQPYTRVTGIIDGKAFTDELAPYMIARKKRDPEVAPDLPEKIIQIVRLEFDAKQEAAYSAIEDADDLLVDVPGATDELLIKNGLGRLLRLQQAASDPRLLGVDIDGVKLDWLREFFEDGVDSCLVLTRFRDTASRIAAMLSAPLVVGGAKIDTRQLKQEPVIVGTIAAVAEGLDLGHIWTTVFIDVEPSSILMSQAIDRTERDLSAERGRHIIYLQAKRSEDARFHAIAEGKIAIQDAVRDYLNGYKRRAR